MNKHLRNIRYENQIENDNDYVANYISYLIDNAILDYLDRNTFKNDWKSLDLLNPIDFSIKLKVLQNVFQYVNSMRDKVTVTKYLTEPNGEYTRITICIISNDSKLPLKLELKDDGRFEYVESKESEICLDRHNHYNWMIRKSDDEYGDEYVIHYMLNFHEI